MAFLFKTFQFLRAKAATAFSAS